jgi:flagellar hook assembly protein FlgD
VSYELDVYAQRVDSTGTLSTPTGIKDHTQTPTFSLYPPAPNPGSGRVEFRFKLPSASDVSIGIYDVRGRRVRMDRIGEVGIGEQRYLFDGRDEAGRLVPSGVYFVRLSADNLVRTQKFVVSH